MQIQLNFKKLRKYLGSFDKRKGKYIVDIDPRYYMPENIDTYYHEFTHNLARLIRDKSVEQNWDNKRIKKYRLTADDEEQLCRAIGEKCSELWISKVYDRD